MSQPQESKLHPPDDPASSSGQTTAEKKEQPSTRNALTAFLESGAIDETSSTAGIGFALIGYPTPSSAPPDAPPGELALNPDGSLKKP